MTPSMRYFDCHSHFSTKAGLHHATQEDYEQAKRLVVETICGGLDASDTSAPA